MLSLLNGTLHSLQPAYAFTVQNYATTAPLKRKGLPFRTHSTIGNYNKVINLLNLPVHYYCHALNDGEVQLEDLKST